MKQALILIFLLFLTTPTAFGCSCANSFASTNNHFITSDFIGIVEVLKSSDSPSEESSYYKIKIEPKMIFKGKAPSTLSVYGNKGYGIISSCGTTVSKGEEWLVYANKNNKGEYSFGYCSFPQLLETKNGTKTQRSDGLKRDLKQLEFLKSQIPNLKRDYMIRQSSNNLLDYLEKYDGQTFNKSSAQYLITFDSNFKIKSIDILKGFSTKFDEAFIKNLKENTTWSKEYYNTDDSGIEENTQHVIGIYYYHEDKKFLSPHDL